MIGGRLNLMSLFLLKVHELKGNTTNDNREGHKEAVILAIEN